MKRTSSINRAESLNMVNSMDYSVAEIIGEDVKLESGQDSDRLTKHDANWYELRLPGRVPDRRAYHSSFIIDDK